MLNKALVFRDYGRTVKCKWLRLSRRSEARKASAIAPPANFRFK